MKFGRPPRAREDLAQLGAVRDDLAQRRLHRLDHRVGEAAPLEGRHVEQAERVVDL